MLRRTFTASCLVLATLGLGLPMASTAQAATTVEATVRSGRLVIPEAIRPGLRSFAVKFRGDDGGISLLRPAAGYTVADMKDDVAASMTGTDRSVRRAKRSLAENVTRLGGAYGQQGQTVTFWQRLYRGRLWVVHEDSGKVTRVRVRGTATGGKAPAAVEVQLFDGAAALPVQLRASDVLQVTNTGSDAHMFGLLTLKPGKTLADVQAYLDSIFEGTDSSLESPIDEAGPSAATTTLSPGRHAWLQHDLPPGSYLMICVELDWRQQTFHFQDGEMGLVSVS